MIATAMVVREMHGEDTGIVYIGPCIDTKDEANLYRSGRLIESVLTFIELRKMFEEFKIQERLVTMSEFDPPNGHWGALYPLPAGIIQAAGIKRDIVTSRVITASGKEEILEAIMTSINQLIRSSIISIFSSAPDVFLVLAWHSIRNGSEEGPL